MYPPIPYLYPLPLDLNPPSPAKVRGWPLALPHIWTLSSFTRGGEAVVCSSKKHATVIFQDCVALGNFHFYGVGDMAAIPVTPAQVAMQVPRATLQPMMTAGTPTPPVATPNVKPAAV